MIKRENATIINFYHEESRRLMPETETIRIWSLHDLSPIINFNTSLPPSLHNSKESVLIPNINLFWHCSVADAIKITYRQSYNFRRDYRGRPKYNTLESVIKILSRRVAIIFIQYCSRNKKYST
jgi:hypothetical protein